MNLTRKIKEMRKILFFLSLAYFTSSAAQTEVVQGVMIGKDYGVVYTLPKTEINIDVKVNKINYVPGEYSRYADRYLRLDNVSTEPEEHWELVSVTASSVGVPDNSQTYFIKLKDRTVAPLVELTPDGLIKSINVPLSEISRPAAVLTPATAVEKKLNPRDFLTEEILMASSSAKVAELISKEIYSIRESRNALLRGQADNMPKDGEQLKLMLDNLEAQERAMVEMFSGTRTTEEKTFTIRITPEQGIDNQVAFRFSKKLGVLDKDDLAGAPFYLSVKDMEAVAIPVETEKDKKKKVEGIAYNVPGKARVSITDGSEKYFEEDLPVTQFGTVEYLAPVLFNKNATIKVLFHPATGGIMKVDRE